MSNFAMKNEENKQKSIEIKNKICFNNENEHKKY